MRNVDAAGLGIGDDHPPRIMGVLNVSEESPYDPSVYDDPSEAAAYVDEDLIGEGADIVDVGLESANKRFEVLSAGGELARLDTAIETLESTSGDAVWSIETRYHEVADEALSRGFDMVNDICGFADPKMPRVCEDHDAAVSKMASPPDLQRPGAIEDVDDIYEALSHNGFTDKTIVDPAFGGWSEAKTLEDDRETLRRLREFRGYGRPILVSINRKNFLREVAGRSTDEALPVSLAATSMAVERGAHVIRTHDVAETRDAALIGAEFARERVRSTGSDRTRPNGKGRLQPNGDGRNQPNGDGRNQPSGDCRHRASGDGRDSDHRVTVEELDVTTTREAERHLERLGADSEIADRATVHVFELHGLDSEELGAVHAATADANAVFALGATGNDPGAGVSGNDSESSGNAGATGLLVGTPAALSAVESDVITVSDVLGDAFRTVSEAYR